MSWTEYKSNDWVPQETRIESHLLDETKKTKLSYLGHILSKDGSGLEKEIIRCTASGQRRREGPRTRWVYKVDYWSKGKSLTEIS